MKSLKIILPVLIFFFSMSVLQAQTGPLPAEVVKAVKTGDAEALKPYLNAKVELLLPGKSGVYSQEQAHFILKDFFENNQVISFEVLHYGSRQSATFAIGEYKCAGERFRMYFLIKSNNNKRLIHQIRIEQQD